MLHTENLIENIYNIDSPMTIVEDTSIDNFVQKIGISKFCFRWQKAHILVSEEKREANKQNCFCLSIIWWLPVTTIWSSNFLNVFNLLLLQLTHFCKRTFLLFHNCPSPPFSSCHVAPPLSSSPWWRSQCPPRWGRWCTCWRQPPPPPPPQNPPHTLASITLCMSHVLLISHPQNKPALNLNTKLN